MKTQIIRELRQADILLPSLVAEGLAANDRIKVRLSALQAAAQHAREPNRPAADLAPESRAAGVDPAVLATLIGGAHLAGNGRMATPHLADLIKEIEADAAAMIDAVTAGNRSDGERAKARLASIRAAGLLEASDNIEIARVARLTGVTQGDADGLHRLVMDLHKALNRLAADCSEEIVAGAHVFGLKAEDRVPVESFMRGVSETRALKFNHPGLDTTATRSGDRLVIQNDIGTTDAHVVVIAVKNNAVTVTYTDVHFARAKFFIALFDAFQARWSGLDRHAAAELGEDSAFFLVTGQYEAGSVDDRNAFLGAVGASLVFLIDWNKARKLLRSWVRHRAFLELGRQ